MTKYVSMAAAAAALMLSVPAAALVLAQGQSATPVLTEMPTGNDTPVPRTSDNRADLSGVWNKSLRANIALPVEPLPFTPERLEAFNDVVNMIDPLARCLPPGVPRVNSSPYRSRSCSCPTRSYSCTRSSTTFV